MKTYLVIGAFSLGGGRDLYVGDVVELDDSTARYKLALGFVMLHTEPPKSAGPAVRVETQDPQFATRKRQ